MATPASTRKPRARGLHQFGATHGLKDLIARHIIVARSRTDGGTSRRINDADSTGWI